MIERFFHPSCIPRRIFSFVLALVAALCVPASNIVNTVSASAYDYPAAESPDSALDSPVSVSVQSMAKGIRITWSTVEGAEGYQISRKTDSSDWSAVKTCTDAKQFSWTNTNVSNGVVYHYRVRAFKTVDGTKAYSDYCEGDSTAFMLTAPGKLTVNSSTSSDSTTLTWSANKAAKKYEIQYASNSLFSDARSVTIEDATTTSTVLTGLGISTRHYFRIRSVSDSTVSDWRLQSTITSSRSASTKKLVTRKGKKLELIKAAKQKLYKYDILEGSCSDGTYMYYALLNKTKNKSKIAKLKLSTGKVVKVSKALNIHHANGLTYNSKEKTLAVANDDGKPWRISVVNASTLKITRHKTVSFPKALLDATSEQLAAIKGLSAIGYSASDDSYIVLLKGSGHMAQLNSSFEATRFIKLSKRNGKTNQDLTVVNDYIVLAESTISGYSGNILTVYNMEGTRKATVSLSGKYEVEGVFMAGNQLYVSYYYSFVKKVKKKVKVEVLTKKGKKKKKKKTIVQYKDWRSDYLYKAVTY